MLFNACSYIVRLLFTAAAVDMLRKDPLYRTTCVFKNSSLIFDKDSHIPAQTKPK
jgi:hypothetical protein